MPMKPKDLIKMLLQEGFVLVRQRGSHAIFKHSDTRMVVVPIHNRDIPNGTLSAILKDAGLRK
jgi:predicted RNA binding protein YcfA (HicA-like mRNA interferase family)